MADRVVSDLSDRLLRQGASLGEIMKFLQMLSVDTNVLNDDFMLALDTRYTLSAGAGSTTWAVLAPTATANEWGVLRGVTGTTDNDAVCISSPRFFRGEYNAVVTMRYRVDAITGIKIEVGFKDATATQTGIVNAINTPTFNATDGVCWVFDTDGTTARWQAMGVSNATATLATVLAAADIGNAPVADTYQTLLVAMLEGDAVFVRYNADGEPQGEPIGIASTQRAGQNLAAWAYFQVRNTSSKNCDLDFIRAWQLRRS